MMVLKVKFRSVNRILPKVLESPEAAECSEEPCVLLHTVGTVGKLQQIQKWVCYLFKVGQSKGL